MHPDPHYDDPDVQDDQVEYIGEGADPEEREKAERYVLGEENEREHPDHEPDAIDEYYYGEEAEKPEEPPL